ncbi:MAG: NUDIX hydrolase [Candidatus Paceibacterota bacterium]
MSKICDHTSVGMVVRQGDKILLIERAKGIKGFALPAGHVDGDKSYEEAARRELKEEVGLEAIGIKLLAEARKENPCRREGGSWHYWKIYAVTVQGELVRSLDETKKAGWYSLEEIKLLGLRTKKYEEGGIAEAEWNNSPGLEPVMYEWFRELKII